MKKSFIAVLLAVIMGFAVLSGCSLIKGLEHDVQVILINDGEYVGTYTVNQFNNAIVPEVEKPVEEGENPKNYLDGTPMYDEDGNAINYTFVGWSVKENWTEEDGEEYLSENTGLIRYDDVKDFVGDESLSITLYAAYSVVPPRDLVIAWYDKETTSGLNQTYMDAFEENLYSYLETQGYDTASMDIVIRGYSGDVGTTCSQIIKDGDVDIMVGWSSTSNITSTGGMVEGVDFLVNNGGVRINPDKSRYAALITNKTLSRLVYSWIFEEYADTTVELPDIGGEQPEEPDPAPSEENELVVAWYDLKETSGLDEYIILLFTNALESYVASADNGAYADYTVVVRAYDGNVATSCGNIKSDGDVDIMIGWGGNIDDKGGMVEGVDYYEHIGDIPMGGKSRYITRLTDDDVTKTVFEWLQLPEGQEALAPIELSDLDLVIGWYAKTSTTGLDQAIIDSFTESLTDYIGGLETAIGGGIEINIVIREYSADLDVAGVGEKVNDDGDVDILLGMGNNITTTGKIDVVERVDNYTMGGKSRNIARLTEDDLTVLAFSWLKTDEVRALFA